MLLLLVSLVYAFPRAEGAERLPRQHSAHVAAAATSTGAPPLKLKSRVLPVSQPQPSTSRQQQQLLQQQDTAKDDGVVTVRKAADVGTLLSILFMLGASAREIALQTRYERRLRPARAPRVALAEDLVRYLAETGVDDATVQCMRNCFPPLVSV